MQAAKEISTCIDDTCLLELIYHYSVISKKCSAQGLMSLYVSMVNNPQDVQVCIGQ